MTQRDANYWERLHQLNLLASFHPNRNLSVESELCSLVPESLNLAQIHQLHLIHYQLLNFIIDCDPDMMLGEGERIRRLEKAILEVPLSSLNRLSLYETFTHINILRSRFGRDCYEYRVPGLRNFMYLGDQPEGNGFKALILLHKAAIEIQIGALSEALAHPNFVNSYTNDNESGSGESIDSDSAKTVNVHEEGEIDGFNFVAKLERLRKDFSKNKNQ
ncbi:hypothetical protein L207DRAFT_575779 [Hyaloscypha variabilis F]|uniref:Uncharacterized protein n=1 Tax=Hyaloscypha variabilis (strain UAMH 11265 / GT02V1 / F) TaxID=1149755 RepID=A0A2J6S889_HYAVF|nr:hypothetical protein L207DRAFT_575779 [Hyaloscypha variabilis F]